MFIPNDDTQNYPFYTLQLEVETFRHSTYLDNQSKFIKSPQSCYIQTLGNSVINSPLSSPSRELKCESGQGKDIVCLISSLPQNEDHPFTKVTGCLFVCVFVPNDLGNH